MASASETSARVARESARRRRLAPPAFGGGLLYLLSGIIISAALNGAPTVGIVQGLAPALRGEGAPAQSPRVSEVRFISHHSFALIAGSALAAIALAALTLILVMLADAARLRRPQMWAAARPLVIAGGISFALVSLLHQIVSAIQTHKFVHGHDFSNHAVEHALKEAAVYQVIDTVALFAGLALAAGMIAVVLASMRVGLLPRWMGILGMFSAVLLFLPIGGATFEIVPAFWMVMAGILFAGRWPNGMPPAWEAGEARPWPSQAQQRAGRAGGRSAPGQRDDAATASDGDTALATTTEVDQDAGTAVDEPVTGATGAAPAPVAPRPSAPSRKRRRKRGGRR